MKVKITAPEGYKYRDPMTGKNHSEVIVDSDKKNKFVLVADTAGRGN